jgi:hypothetical protein
MSINSSLNRLLQLGNRNRLSKPKCESGGRLVSRSLLDIVAVRFGNGVIEVTYGSTDDAAQVSSISNQLLQASAAKAKSAF